MSLSQLKQLVKDNGIKKTSHLNRTELISLLTEKGIAIPAREPKAKRKPQATEETTVQPVTEVTQVTEEATVQPVTEVAQVAKDYERLKTIRSNPRRVRLTDVATNEAREFKSLYSAGKFLNHSSKIIHDYNGKVYKGKYLVQILPIEEEPKAVIEGNGGVEESQS